MLHQRSIVRVYSLLLELILEHHGRKILQEIRREFDRVLQQKWPLWLQELEQQTGYVRSRVLRIPVHHVFLCISRQFEWLDQHQRRSRGEQQAVSLSLNEASFISNYVHKILPANQSLM